MRFADLITGRQIGNCAGHPLHPMIATCRQLKPLSDRAQKLLCLWRKFERRLQSLAAGISIGADHCMGFVALGLPRPRRIHARGHHGRAIPTGGQIKIVKRHRRHIKPQIKAVHERSGNPPKIICPANRGAPARAVRIAEMATFARVGRSDQHKAAGIFHMGICPRNHHAASFDGLAQGF